MPRGAPRLRTKSGKLNQVGPRVRQRRLEMDLQQDELCARLALKTGGGWNPGWQDLSRIENGRRTVSDLEVLALAGALDCDPAWLLAGDLSGPGGRH